MSSDFSEACRDARAEIEVPPIPLAAIRTAFQQSARPSPRRRKRFIAASLAGFAIVAVAAAAEYLIGTHVSVSSSGPMRVSTVENLRFKPHPSRKDLLDAVRGTNFQAKLPPWVPGNGTPTQMVYGPSIIQLSYDLPGSSRRSDHLLWIVLVNPLALDATKSNPHARIVSIMGGEAAKGSVVWRIGRETVVVPHSTATAQELAHIKAAMEAQANR